MHRRAIHREHPISFRKITKDTKGYLKYAEAAYSLLQKRIKANEMESPEITFLKGLEKHGDRFFFLVAEKKDVLVGVLTGILPPRAKPSVLYLPFAAVEESEAGAGIATSLLGLAASEADSALLQMGMPRLSYFFGEVSIPDSEEASAKLWLACKSGGAVATADGRNLMLYEMPGPIPVESTEPMMAMVLPVQGPKGSITKAEYWELLESIYSIYVLAGPEGYSRFIGKLRARAFDRLFGVLLPPPILDENLVSQMLDMKGGEELPLVSDPKRIMSMEFRKRFM